MDFDKLSRLELTPDKSKVITSKNGSIKIVYVNKVGKVKKREECKQCKYLSKVQIGLGWGITHCCDVSPKGWKEFDGITERKCKLFEVKGVR